MYPLFKFYAYSTEILFLQFLESDNSIFWSDKRKIETAEVRFLRPMAGYTLWDKKRSSDIREKLGIFNINDKLTQYKINCREHTQRIDDC